MTSEEHTEINRLRAEVRRLEEDNKILRAVTVFFAGELDRAEAALPTCFEERSTNGGGSPPSRSGGEPSPSGPGGAALPVHRPRPRAHPLRPGGGVDPTRAGGG